MNRFSKTMIWVGLALFLYSILKPFIFDISAKQAFLSSIIALVFVFIGLIPQEKDK